jgi:hypothetical protein
MTAMRASLDRSPRTLPRPVPPPTRRARRRARPRRRRTGARKRSARTRQNRAPSPPAQPSAMRAGVSSITTIPQVLALGLYPCDRLRSLLRGAHAIERGDRVRHRWRCSGALPDRVGISTTGGAAQDGAHTRSDRDLAFPGSLRPRRQSWPDGRRPFVAFDQLRRSNFPGARAAPSNAVRSALGKGSLWKEEHGTR